MAGPDGDPAQVYMINTDYLKRMVEWYLTPVIDKLGELRDGYAEAQAEVKAAHDNETVGWFGGEGNGVVPPASSSFLNEVGYQLGQLVSDQTALASSLADYRTFLLDHASWAEQQDKLHADTFVAIHRELEEFGRS